MATAPPAPPVDKRKVSQLNEMSNRINLRQNFGVWMWGRSISTLIDSATTWVRRAFQRNEIEFLLWLRCCCGVAHIFAWRHAHRTQSLFHLSDRIVRNTLCEGLSRQCVHPFIPWYVINVHRIILYQINNYRQVPIAMIANGQQQLLFSDSIPFIAFGHR